MAHSEFGKRLLVLLALNRRRLDRRWAASALWPDGTDDRAAATCARPSGDCAAPGSMVEADRVCLGLNGLVEVDVDLVDGAGRITQGAPRGSDLRLHPHSGSALDLLPDWYDDWGS